MTKRRIFAFLTHAAVLEKREERTCFEIFISRYNVNLPQNEFPRDLDNGNANV